MCVRLFKKKKTFLPPLRIVTKLKPKLRYQSELKVGETSNTDYLLPLVISEGLLLTYCYRG